MRNDNKKAKRLKELKPKVYQIFGIFNFETDELVSVNMDMDKLIFEFSLAGYDEDTYDIVAFNVLVN